MGREVNGTAVALTEATTRRSRRLPAVALATARWALLGLTMSGIRVGRRSLLGARSQVEVRGEGRLDVGDRVVVRDDFHCYVQGRLRIGDGVFINRWAYVSAFLDVSIGDGVRIGERVSIHDENHDMSAGNAEYLAAPVTIGRHSWLGANVVVLPGAVIGEGCVIAAGAVVRGVIPSHTMAAGVPARVIRALDH